ncbi:putative NRAMP family protein [Helianthus annuus]|nr:putative NRAMP family protein [Helianthus annuus]
METDNMIAKSHPNTTHRLLPAVLPVLFIAITYVDPGKWVAAIEGGARFGYDLIVLMFVFSLAAVLCQYLSASIAVVTGKDLAQICSTEYDTVTCVFLGIQAELSMIALDLTMLLGTAHALNLTFGIGLFTCVVLTSLDAFLFPVVSSYLECGKAKFICMWLAAVALFSYFFGVVTSQRDTSLSMGGMLTNLSGESAFALMGLLGASIMPHNLYLHSSMVQQDQGPTQISKGALCHDHLFAISCVFSGIFVINCFLMNSAANVFYSTGLDLLTFQDALSLMDQVFRSFMAPFALIIVLVLSYHTTALMWKFSGQSVLLNFFKLDIPGWCHHSTIRFISLIPALLSTWHSGAEVPNCGDDCVWRIELIKSFGVWCMHRILELSLMESRPELWGKYTYVLNRLQGIIEPAFSKPRVPTSPCFCLQVPDTCQQRSSPPKSTTSFPPQAKPSRGKCTTAASLLDIVKNVETAISCRKGRPGTAAGDVAFPKGKENLASVLKRYKRRLLAVAPDGLSRSP